MKDIEHTLNNLSKSKFRNSFHLNNKMKEYVKEKGLDIIKNHAYDFINDRIRPAFPKNDGKQTPMRQVHPVFIAQHATACCCRNCLLKWHNIPKGKELTKQEVDYIVNLIISWIKKESENQMGLKIGTVKLEKYNKEWETEFLKEKEELKKLFGTLALSIEHVGSTSVKGLTAKPIIDIAIGLKDLNDFDKIRDNFKPPYYVKENPTEGEELVVKRINNDITTHLIHVMQIDSERYKDTIIFRDYLKTNKETVKNYENLKKELAIKYKNDRPSYTASKNDFIKGVLKEAKSNIE